jgi:replicative DNA helicase
MLRFRKFSEILTERAEAHVDMAARKARGERVFPFLPTGLKAWDANGGITIGVATCIAAHSGEGKSAVKLQLAKAVAESGAGVVYCFELEDPTAKTAERQFAAATGVASNKIGTLNYEPSFPERLRQAAREAQPWAAKVEMHEGLVNAEDVKEWLATAPNDCVLVMLDYAQGLGTDGLEKLIADIAWHLNAWCQTKQRAAIIFSQTKAEVESRGKTLWDREQKIDGYRPMGRGDIKWAAALGERCKAVIYLFRPGRWLRKHGGQGKDDTMEIIFDKSNFGGEGTVTLTWIGAETRLVDR